jgi:hypothetical protein
MSVQLLVRPIGVLIVRYLGWVLCGLLACAPASPARVVPVPATESPNGEVRNLRMSGVVDLGAGRSRLVIRDSLSWAKLWPEGRGERQRPMIDFATSIVILVSTRKFSGTGPRIAIDSVRLGQRELTAYVRTASCDGPWGGGHRITTPMHAIAVPRVYDKIKFLESYESFWGCFSARPDTTA